METFTDPEPFSSHPGYEEDRSEAIGKLEQVLRIGEIDLPLVHLLRECARIPHIFTIQSCYGHFVHQMEPDIKNLSTLSRFRGNVDNVQYRLAYIVFCIRDSREGHIFYSDFQKLKKIDPLYIQFGSATWFLERMKNTYVVQVVPDRAKYEDTVVVDFEEGLYIEKVRDLFFEEIGNIVRYHRNFPDS